MLEHSENPNIKALADMQEDIKVEMKDPGLEKGQEQFARAVELQAKFNKALDFLKQEALRSEQDKKDAVLPREHLPVEFFDQVVSSFRERFQYYEHCLAKLKKAEQEEHKDDAETYSRIAKDEANYLEVKVNNILEGKWKDINI